MEWAHSGWLPYHQPLYNAHVVCQPYGLIGVGDTGARSLIHSAWYNMLPPRRGGILKEDTVDVMLSELVSDR